MLGLGRLSVSDTVALSFDGFSRVGRIWSYGVGLVVLYLKQKIGLHECTKLYAVTECFVHYINSTLFAYIFFICLTLKFNFNIYLAKALYYSPVNLDRCYITIMLQDERFQPVCLKGNHLFLFDCYLYFLID